MNCKRYTSALQIVYDNAKIESSQRGVNMDFEVRHQDLTFKHTVSEKPDMSEERFKEHFHTTYELLYFVRGNADYMVEHRLYNIEPGSLLIAKPGEYHNIIFRSDEPYERYVLRFPPIAVHPYVRRQLERSNTVYYIKGTMLEDAFLQMDKHITSVHDDLRVALCYGVLNIITAHIISSQDLIRHADYINEEARTVVKYIEENLPGIRSAEDIAKALHMSKSALYKIFTAQFKTPVMTYVRTQKCMLARDLLHEGMSATETAEKLGYTHYSSFYRDYMHVFGTAPTKQGA